MKPNLFEFATSELSQDAFLAWLLAWADVQHRGANPQLHALGRKFLFALLKLHDVEPEAADHSHVNVRRQVFHVDIIVEIGDTLIAIEDKTYTGLHSGNEKALGTLESKYAGKKVLRVYLKTGDQASYDEVTTKGFKPLLRANLLAILQEDPSLLKENAILGDFAAFLERREYDVNEWKRAALDGWVRKPVPWAGFYKRLQEEFSDLVWKYVPNPMGGFMGAWWNWRDWNGAKVYLQITQGPLQFRIQGLRKDANYIAFCRETFAKLQSLAQTKGLPLSKTRLRYGDTMAVAEVEISGWLAANSEGKIDLQTTLQRLKAAGDVVDSLKD